MKAWWLHDALQVSGLNLPQSYPRDLVSTVPLQLPLAFVPVRKLATNTLEQWLTRRRISYRAVGARRRLHGALVARAGRGLVFIDSSDDFSDQRFTAAHETAHFIEEHVKPRLKALKAFGGEILPVLDGERPPTPEESVSAVLNRVPLGIHVHLMARSQHGAIYNWDVEEREQRADRLALELLAPAKDALRMLCRDSAPASAPTAAPEAARILSQSFGLPISVARPYADLLLGGLRSRPKLTEVLLGGNR